MHGIYTVFSAHPVGGLTAGISFPVNYRTDRTAADSEKMKKDNFFDRPELFLAVFYGMTEKKIDGSAGSPGLRSGPDKRVGRYYPIFIASGAILWAVRGTAGYGGFEGALLPGLIWGFCFMFTLRLQSERDKLNRRYIPHYGMAAFLSFFGALGIAAGGLMGYGEYASWIVGIRHTGIVTEGIYETIPISPIYGYLWAFICGGTWMMLAVFFIQFGYIIKNAADFRGSSTGRSFIILSVVFPLIFAIAFIGFYIAAEFGYIPPVLLYPDYSPELYNPDTCPQCVTRTVSTNLFTGALAFACFITGMLSIPIMDAVCGKKREDRTVYGVTTGYTLQITRRMIKLYPFTFIFGGAVFSAAINWMGLGLRFGAVIPFDPEYWKLWEICAGAGFGFIIGRIYRMVSDAVYIYSGPESDGNTVAKNGRVAVTADCSGGGTYAFSVFVYLGVLFWGGSYGISSVLSSLTAADPTSQYEFGLVRIIIVSILELPVFSGYIASLRMRNRIVTFDPFGGYGPNFGPNGSPKFECTHYGPDKTEGGPTGPSESSEGRIDRLKHGLYGRMYRIIYGIFWAGVDADGPSDIRFHSTVFFTYVLIGTAVGIPGVCTTPVPLYYAVIIIFLFATIYFKTPQNRIR